MQNGIMSMKSIYLRKLLSMVLWASIALCAISCNTPEEQSVKFPDLGVIKCSAGDRPEINFSVASNWRLSSDAKWCKFKTANSAMQDISGRAGEQNIMLVITNEQIKDRVTTAKISLIMGGKSAVIAKVERDADKAYLKIYDENGKPTDGVITIGYGNYTKIFIEANFDFAAVEYPELLDASGSISGVSEEQVEAYVRIVPDGERERRAFGVEAGFEVVFSDAEHSADKTFRCPIVYRGMDDEDIAILGPTMDEFGWEVTPDGKGFSQLNGEDEVVTFENELQYKISANNDLFNIVYIENVIERGMPSFEVYTEGDSCWMHFDKESMTLTLDATDRLRYGYVMAMPKGVYDKISNKLKSGELFESDNSTGIELPVLKNIYLQYVAISLTQHGTVEADTDTQMHIYHSITAYNILAESYTDTDIMAQYGVSEAYIAPFINSIAGRQPCIVINPRIEEWTTEGYEAANIGVDVWYKGEKLSMTDNEYYIGENVDELLSLQLYGPKEGFEIGGENIYVVFTVGGEAKKLLVVTPPTK